VFVRRESGSVLQDFVGEDSSLDDERKLMTLAVLWTRAALLTRRRVGLPQGGSEVERTIGDSDRWWNGEPTVCGVEEQFKAALLAVADAVDDGNPILLAAGRGPYDHEQALLRISQVLMADSHVDPGHPDRDVLLSGEVAATPLVVFREQHRMLIEEGIHLAFEAAYSIRLALSPTIESSGLRPLSTISSNGAAASREDRTTLAFDPGLSELRTVKRRMVAYRSAPTWGGRWGRSPGVFAAFFHAIDKHDFRS